ncbi:S9 family peptidase [Amorphus orientalis]|uniref:Oligopeptidase B n=1 Tax=Amorphus orientalis TaxID=649198 RepID=A0AAE3VNW1_9HYPH|nr:S9 family peptidase [Amorphus orientalis]MDQ0315100.1 oligopeptidase B [Amorphus orientalis]
MSEAATVTGDEAPIARTSPVERTVQGHALVDPYAWLRADNWREVMRDPSVLSPEIRGYLEAENAYAERRMAPTDELRQTLFAELKGRIKEDDSTVPTPDGPYAYAVRYLEGAEHPLIVRTPRAGGEETVLLDANAEARDKSYFRLGGMDHSTDHRWLAWAADETGGEMFTIRIRDLDSGTDLDERIEHTAGSVVWAADGRTLFYVQLDDNHRPARVYRHTLGTPSETDVLVYEEADPGFFVGVGRSLSDRFIVIDTHDHETSEVHLIDAAVPDGPSHLVAPRVVEQEYDVDDRGDRLYVLTNADGAEDFKIVTAPLDNPGRETWRELVPHVPGRLILSMTVFSGHLVRLEREDGLPRIVVRDLETGEEHAIAFDEEAYSLGLAGGYEFDTTTLRFTYSSMTTPARVYDYDMVSRQRTLRKEQEVPSGHDPDHYVTRRLHFTAPDGESVPVSILYHRDTKIDGTAPCLLYGYGSYGITIPAGFSTNALSLVNRGFVYAIAHIRGGRDKGYHWYRDGRREKKENTFTDFIACAEGLVADGWIAPDRIVAQGGSAGGMLMGAIANLAPDRFRGVVAEVPFVDVLNTMLDETLPLTPPEWPEWGNPIEDPEAFERMLRYSPYDNVTEKAYPAMLVLAGVTDPRVTYWEPAKWVARLRASATNDPLIVFKTNMDAGHGGASGRFQRLEEVALIQAFALAITETEAAKIA